MKPSLFFKCSAPLVGLLSSVLLTSQAYASVIASFDDLPLPPALNGSANLQYTNASNSLQYQGVNWDAGFTVVGDEYRVASNGPLFGIPHSGHYFVTNQGGMSGLLINTSQVLTGAWFGRNQYYGFGEGGADQITITALYGANQESAISFDLPESHPGQPEPLSFFNTIVFSALPNITGYRIDRRELGSQRGHWVADDFQFQDAVSNVPEPGTLPLLGVGLAALFVYARRKQAR